MVFQFQGVKCCWITGAFDFYDLFFNLKQMFTISLFTFMIRTSPVDLPGESGLVKNLIILYFSILNQKLIIRFEICNFQYAFANWRDRLPPGR